MTILHHEPARTAELSEGIPLLPPADPATAAIHALASLADEHRMEWGGVLLLRAVREALTAVRTALDGPAEEWATDPDRWAHDEAMRLVALAACERQAAEYGEQLRPAEQAQDGAA